ncbi:MAG: hypothetical protein EBY21_11550, partial [Alphaproteobacteria bacterium]|nr:hypothetical protein [Alphaproteobacteria bacterium]
RHIPGSHLGIHTHNDTENAVANSLAAIDAGVRHRAKLCRKDRDVRVSYQFHPVSMSGQRRRGRPRLCLFSRADQVFAHRGRPQPL